MSQKKLEQLGLPIGPATHRLRKLLLFHLARALQLNHCHRCRQAIHSPDDLGIDHKEPWLDVSVERFWDLGNVAFSHKLCNTRASRSAIGRKLGPSSLRKVAPPGMLGAIAATSSCRPRALTAIGRSGMGYKASAGPARGPINWLDRDQCADGASWNSERVGFEPTEPAKVQRFSRPPHSTALPPLQARFMRVFSR